MTDLYYSAFSTKKRVMTCPSCYKSTQEKRAKLWRGKGYPFGEGNGIRMECHTGAWVAKETKTTSYIHGKDRI